MNVLRLFIIIYIDPHTKEITRICNERRIRYFLEHEDFLFDGMVPTFLNDDVSVRIPEWLT